MDSSTRIATPPGRPAWRTTRSARSRTRAASGPSTRILPRRARTTSRRTRGTSRASPRLPKRRPALPRRSKKPRCRRAGAVTRRRCIEAGFGMLSARGTTAMTTAAPTVHDTTGVCRDRPVCTGGSWWIGTVSWYTTCLRLAPGKGVILVARGGYGVTLKMAQAIPVRHTRHATPARQRRDHAAYLLHEWQRSGRARAQAPGTAAQNIRRSASATHSAGPQLSHAHAPEPPRYDA